ncbi:uncharacterized protein [Paramormyrops kingsleyae]|uniref:Zgc:113425 n=1 Tax=Paramormyrops kingsleyae TaxID=1676925 RepID=A0A3B3SRH2_9TELE|nr:uncharacterized protein LOC111847326 isoform X3 [Paramormyrops kingsleyae]XP_023674168.1 uncharacterized protein LOC111847326 isoform X3 [Paramormyrops kingsleyae]
MEGREVMDRYRYFMFNQRRMVVLGILQVACAGLCVVCGFIDAAFRKSTALSSTRAPMWAGMVMAVPGVLALFSSQKKNPILVNAMIAASVFSCFTTLIVAVYAVLTLSYGEDDDELFHPSHVGIPKAKFILSRMVKGANGTMLLSCCGSILLSVLISLVGCRSLPFCGCYDSSTGLETLVPQDEPNPQAELICTWQAGGDDRLFNSPVQPSDKDAEEEAGPAKAPPYIRLTS